MNNYWTDTTDQCILRYNSTSSLQEKNIIYETQLRPTILKLCECVFHFHKRTCKYFSNIAELEAVAVKALPMLDKDKGNFYSYITAAVRNYMFHTDNKQYRYESTCITSIHTQDGEQKDILDIIEEETPTESEHVQLIRDFINWFEKHGTIKHPIYSQYKPDIVHFMRNFDKYERYISVNGHIAMHLYLKDKYKANAANIIMSEIKNNFNQFLNTIY